MLAVEVEIDASAAAKWLPNGITLREPARATYFIGLYPQSGCCGPYGEAALLLDVDFQGGPARHCPWMLVDDDTALVLGRDMLGYPKKMGEISVKVDESNDRIEAYVDRNGVRLLQMQGQLGDTAQNPPGIFVNPVVNVWGVVPRRSEGGLENLPRLLETHLTETIREAREVELELQVAGTNTDPIDAISPGTIRGAWLYRTDMGNSQASPLAWGTVDVDWIGRTWPLRYR